MIAKTKTMLGNAFHNSRTTMAVSSVYILMTSCDTSKFKESNKSGNEKSDPYCGVRGWPLVVGVEWTGGGATMATIVGGQVFVLPR